jgi:hypothetical protein
MELLQLNDISDILSNERPPALLPARSAYRPEDRAYASERGFSFSLTEGSFV